MKKYDYNGDTSGEADPGCTALLLLALIALCAYATGFIG